MTQKCLSEDQIMQYLERLELEEASNEDILNLGEDVTVLFEEVKERTTREVSSEDEEDLEDIGGPSCSFITPPLTTSHVDAVAVPDASHSVAGITTYAIPNGATDTEKETTVRTRGHLRLTR